jgi:hypothetical protein
MHHCPNPVQDGPQLLTGAQVQGDQFYGELLDPAPVACGAGSAPDLPARCEQGLGDMTADEAGGAGYQREAVGGRRNRLDGSHGRLTFRS